MYVVELHTYIHAQSKVRFISQPLSICVCKKKALSMQRVGSGIQYMRAHPSTSLMRYIVAKQSCFFSCGI